MSVEHAEASKVKAGITLRQPASAALIIMIAFGPLTASAQDSGLNHLDCWFDEAAKAVQCTPISGLQTGRASRIDRAFDAVDPPAPSLGPAAPPSSTHQARPAPKRRAVEVANRNPKTPSCASYKTYDAATKSYRGYDGVVRKCR